MLKIGRKAVLHCKRRSVREILHSSVPKLLEKILSAPAVAYQDRNTRRMREKKSDVFALSIFRELQLRVSVYDR